MKSKSNILCIYRMSSRIFLTSIRLYYKSYNLHLSGVVGVPHGVHHAFQCDSVQTEERNYFSFLSGHFHHLLDDAKQCFQMIYFTYSPWDLLHSLQTQQVPILKVFGSKNNRILWVKTSLALFTFSHRHRLSLIQDSSTLKCEFSIKKSFEVQDCETSVQKPRITVILIQTDVLPKKKSLLGQDAIYDCIFCW